MSQADPRPGLMTPDDYLRQAVGVLLLAGLFNLAYFIYYLTTLRTEVRAEVEQFAAGQLEKRKAEIEETLEKERAKDEPDRILIKHHEADLAELKSVDLQSVEDEAVRFRSIIAYVSLGLAGSMVVLALLLRWQPVLLAMLALVLFVGAGVVMGLLDVRSLMVGLTVRAITLLALFRVVFCAMQYELAADPG